MIHCASCFRTGIVLAIPIEEHPGATPFGFRCSCDHGRRRGAAFPIWDSKYLARYRVIEQQVYDSNFDSSEWNKALPAPPLRLVHTEKTDVDL